MFCVYVLKSEKSGRHYIGSTEDIVERLIIHNSNKVTSTKNKGPWKLLYIENFDTREQAVTREREIKSYKGGNSFKKLILAG